MSVETIGGSWEELAQRAYEPAPSHEIDTLRHFLSLVVDSTPYAVAVEAVREIVRMRPVTPIPRVRSEVRGVISLRGEILQVVDLRRRLGLEPRTPGRLSRIIVLQVSDDLTAGVLVDGVSEVLRVSERELSPPLGGDRGAVEALITRGETFVSVLDLERVLGVVDGD